MEDLTIVYPFSKKSSYNGDFDFREVNTLICSKYETR